MSASSTMRKTYSGLIGKSDIGKTKAPLYQLPHADFTYGAPSGDQPEGVKEVTSSWKVHTPTKAAVQKKNFKSLNKMSVNFGLSTAKNFRQVANANEKRLVPNVGTKLVALVLPGEEFVFGQPNRPSTPMQAVVSHNYGNVAAKQTEDIYRTRVAETYVQADTRPKTTKTVQLAMETTAKKIGELNSYGSESNLYKMKKFQVAKTKLDTFNRNYTPANQRRPQTAAPSMTNSARKL